MTLRSFILRIRPDDIPVVDNVLVNIAHKQAVADGIIKVGVANI